MLDFDNYSLVIHLGEATRDQMADKKACFQNEVREIPSRDKKLFQAGRQYA